jgi:hypothetical protein
MRDWMLPLAPVIAIVYFAIYPHQFGEFVNWAGTFVH